MKNQIHKIVTEAIAELNDELHSEELKSITTDTRLYGSKSALDSIALVTLISDIEESVGSQFGKDIVLADERAMNERVSPFARVGTLIDYIEKLLTEKE